MLYPGVDVDVHAADRTSSYRLSIIVRLGRRLPSPRASSQFRCIALDLVNEQDMAGNVPDPTLAARTQPAEFGQVDAFLTHSWSDDSALKWRQLQQWRATFKAIGEAQRSRAADVDRQGEWVASKRGVQCSLRYYSWRSTHHAAIPALNHFTPHPPPSLDHPSPSIKFCIDQNAIESSLLCLPVYLASCKQLVICAGDTYTERLWCVMGKSGIPVYAWSLSPATLASYLSHLTPHHLAPSYHTDVTSSPLFNPLLQPVRVIHVHDHGWLCGPHRASPPPN